MSSVSLTHFAKMDARRVMAGSMAAVPFDRLLLAAAVTLLLMGLVMIASASIGIADRQVGEPFHYLYRQAAYASAGLLSAYLVWRTPLDFWERTGPLWLIAAIALLVVLLVPGLGRTVNGSTRWLHLGPVNVQVSELVKLSMIVYLAGYLLRRGDEVRTTIQGFLKPMAVVGLCAVLLLAQPDFGATVVIGATAMGMLFLGGVRLWLFALLAGGAVGAAALLAISSPYRMERLTAFLNPWADPFNSGFQLTQALIAFGRGEVGGVGLGASVQKLFYLPEAHTDFVYAVLAEELGLLGASAVIVLFAVLIWRGFMIGREALRQGQVFGGHLAYGLSLWLAMQAFINMGVNMGLLPTKGLTLPLMSYGGSSMVVSCVAIGLLLRVDQETRARLPQKRGARS